MRNPFTCVPVTVYTYDSIDHITLVSKESLSIYRCAPLKRDVIHHCIPNTLERACHIVDAHNLY